MDLEQLRYEVDILIADRNAAIINFAKAPNRTYTKKFLISKKEQVTKPYDKVVNHLTEHGDKFSKDEISLLLKVTQQKYNELVTIRKEQFVNAKDPIKLLTIAIIFLFYVKLKRRLNKMAPTVDIKLGTTLVPMHNCTVPSRNLINIITFC